MCTRPGPPTPVPCAAPSLKAFHLWSNNWNVAGNTTFMRMWIDKHIEDCEC